MNRTYLLREYSDDNGSIKKYTAFSLHSVSQHLCEVTREGKDAKYKDVGNWNKHHRFACCVLGCAVNDFRNAL